MAVKGGGASPHPLHDEDVAAAESDTAAPMIHSIGDEADPRAENTMARGEAQAQGKFNTEEGMKIRKFHFERSSWSWENIQFLWTSVRESQQWFQAWAQLI